MAIQVSGTEVISNARALNNIASVDATTVASFAAAGVGGAPLFAGWDPTSTPDVTLTSSTTWTKPAGVSADAFVVFYAVGGGSSGAVWNGGFSRSGGTGAAAAIVTGLMSSLPSSISITVGAGGVFSSPYPAQGGNTTLTANGITFTAPKGRAWVNNAKTLATDLYFLKSDNPFSDQSLITLVQSNGGNGGFANAVGGDTIFGAAGGGGAYDYANAGGVSTYAGNGGQGAPSGGTAGSVPGGGGGGASEGVGGIPGSGGAGSVRIWYTT
jgi:hypothetical protein